PRAGAARRSPRALRPSGRSCSVAYVLASTVGSRVPGFVTKCPSLIFDVSCAASASNGPDSCQSTWESYVQPYSKPCSSASLISSRKRAEGGSGRTVTPKLSMEPPRGSVEHIAGARRRQRRASGEKAEDQEPEATIAGQRERQPDEWRAGDDRERGPAVDEADRGARRVRARVRRADERRCERDPRRETDGSRGGDERCERKRRRERGRSGAAGRQARGDPEARAPRVRAQERSAQDAREEAEQERQRACGRRGALRVPVPLEQRDDPVPRDDAERERRGVDRREPIQPRVPEEAPVEPLARVTRGARRRRCEGEQREHERDYDDRAEERSAKADCVGERRHDEERDTRREHRSAAVHAL